MDGVVRRWYLMLEKWSHTSTEHKLPTVNDRIHHGECRGGKMDIENL